MISIITEKKVPLSAALEERFGRFSFRAAVIVFTTIKF